MSLCSQTRLAIADSVVQQNISYLQDAREIALSHWLPVSGGSINQAYRVSIGKYSLFIKVNEAKYTHMFQAEREGLEALQNASVIRVPKVYACGDHDSHSWIVMEHIILRSHSPASQRLLGEQLAMLHRCTMPMFGWHRDNTIGSTTQINQQHDNWVVFYREQRLAYQLQLARKNGFAGAIQEKGAKILEHMHVFFTDYSPTASLLHGDLWSGNHATDSDGNPVIFDPATYYGDRESDIAMTELFGALSPSFYQAYDEVFALDKGYQTRKNLYHLYHILNHANLFGAGYIKQAESIMDVLLSEC